MFLINSAPAAAKLTGSAAGSAVFALASNSAKACILTVPGSGKLEGIPFNVRASGNIVVTGSVSPTAAFVLQSGSSLTFASNTSLLTGAANTATTTVNLPWCLDVEITGTTAAGTVSGNGVVQVGASTPAFINLATPLSGLIFTPPQQGGPDATTVANEPVLNLVMGVTIGGTVSAYTAIMNQFILEA